jgi:hypothetical protein
MSLFFNDEISSIPCTQCGGKVVEFSIPNDIWNKVIRLDGHESSNEYLCVNCWFDALRVALGIEAVEHRVQADGALARAFYCHCPSCNATGLPELFLRRR